MAWRAPITRARCRSVTYQVQRYKFQGARAFTNKPPCGPKRGHGTPQPRFALEVHLDKIAEDLKLDPAELRLKHLVPPDSLTANYLRVGSMGLGKCIEKVVAGSDWKHRFRKLPFGKGVGLACSSYISGAGLPIYWNNMPHSGVQLKCDRGGGVTRFLRFDGHPARARTSHSRVHHGGSVLGIDPFDIRIVTADTEPHAGGPGQRFLARHADERQRSVAGRGARPRDHRAPRGGAKLKVPVSEVVFARVGECSHTEDP